MGDKLVEVKQRQEDLSQKIILLQENELKKDNEVKEIQNIIKECKDNLKQIKQLMGGSEPKTESKQSQSIKGSIKSGGRVSRSQSGVRQGNSAASKEISPSRPKSSTGSRQESNTGSVASKERSSSRPKSATASGQESKAKVVCTVDLNNCKLRVNGELEDKFEDIRQFNATELMDVLDQYECEELIIQQKSDEEDDICPPCGRSKSKSQNECEDLTKRKKKKYSANAGCGDTNKSRPCSSVGQRSRDDEDDTDEDNGCCSQMMRAEECDDETPIISLMHPGNFVMIGAILMISFLIHSDLSCKSGDSRLMYTALFMFAFVCHYGLVLFMGVIKNLVLHEEVDREAFASLDDVLQQKHFLITSILSSVMLYSFLVTHSKPPCESWSTSESVQLYDIIASILLELAMKCYIVAPTLNLRDSRHDPEQLGKLELTMSAVNIGVAILMGVNMYYIAMDMTALD